ncbi:MAG: 50S ribosomal protein L9 [Pseudomonadota bacterium]|nr:50S ribosomal protein L9 [Pseudomonadota bacterium]
MEVILLENIRNLGIIGDRVKVKGGYARNFLVPHGKAIYANERNLAQFEARREELLQKAAEVKAAAETRGKTIADLSLVITAIASEEGKLFGSIGPREISRAFEDLGHNVDKIEIDMPEGPIRDIGEYNINVLLHAEVVIPIKVTVNAEVSH